MTEPNAPRRLTAALALATGLALVLAACGSAALSVPPIPSGALAVPSIPAPSVPQTTPNAGGSAKPSEGATVTPPAAPTAKATAAPTPKPTAEPTAKPTAKPTAVPTATPIIATTSCTTADGSITNSYPVAWSTVTANPEFACMFFSNVPIVINANTGYPLAPIHVTTSRVSFNAAVLAATDVKYWKSVSKTPMKIAGLPAMLIVAITTGTGNWPRDTERYGWIVDWGANGTIVLQTTGPEGDNRLIANKLVLDLMAKKIEIKPAG